MAQDVSRKSQELARRLWGIADELRGSMDSSKFKDYILGVIFYRYLSERTEDYINNELLANDGITYEEAIKDDDLAETIWDWSLDNLGYIMRPGDTFRSLVQAIKDGTFSISDFEKAIARLVESTLGHESEVAFDKLFDDMNLQDKDLGKEVSDRTRLISAVMLRISDISFDFNDVNFDVLGTAYMQLIALFASDAGKKGGEFFTPTCASELLARLSTVGLKSVRSVCDCAAGSGSLMLEVKRALETHNVGHFYGQEKNGSTYNLLRMNMLMHGVPYSKFTMFNDDTLLHDNFALLPGGDKFQIQVANPPYSLKWSASKEFLDDPRFSAAGALAPKSYADLAFVEHMVYHMADDGRIAVLLPHGVLFRGNNEKKIREYLIGTLNCVDAIIGLPANLFHGTSIPTIVMVLKKDRGEENSKNICFIDASKHYAAGKNMNELRPKDIDLIVQTYEDRKDVDKLCHVATLEEVKDDNDYNLNIPRYVDTFEEEETVSIDDVRQQIADARQRKQDALRNVNDMLRQLGVQEV